MLSSVASALVPIPTSSGVQYLWPHILANIDWLLVSLCVRALLPAVRWNLVLCFVCFSLTAGEPEHSQSVHLLNFMLWKIKMSAHDLCPLNCTFSYSC